MPFSSNEDLPSAVQNSLSDADQSQWREVFNAALEEYGDEETAFRVAWSSVQKSGSCRHFEGYASVGVVDKQNDKISIKGLAEAMGAYLNRGGILLDSHSNRPVGQVYAYEVRPKGDADGIYIYGTIWRNEALYDKVWNDILQNKKNAFSIGADPTSKPRTVCDAEKCWNEYDTLHLFEISTVSDPANPGAYMESFNEMAKHIVKSLDENDIGQTESMKEELKKTGAGAATSCECPKPTEVVKQEEPQAQPDLSEFFKKFLDSQAELMKSVNDTNANVLKMMELFSKQDEPEEKPEEKPEEEEKPPEEEPEPEEEKPEEEEKSKSVKKSDKKLEELINERAEELIRKRKMDEKGIDSPNPSVEKVPTNPIAAKMRQYADPKFLMKVPREQIRSDFPDQDR